MISLCSGAKGYAIELKAYDRVWIGNAGEQTEDVSNDFQDSPHEEWREVPCLVLDEQPQVYSRRDDEQSNSKGCEVEVRSVSEASSAVITK